eukprot:jgi/Tetstr1/457333/TSEL_043937.t1
MYCWPTRAAWDSPGDHTYPPRTAEPLHCQPGTCGSSRPSAATARLELAASDAADLLAGAAQGAVIISLPATEADIKKLLKTRLHQLVPNGTELNLDKDGPPGLLGLLALLGCLEPAGQVVEAWGKAGWAVAWVVVGWEAGQEAVGWGVMAGWAAVGWAAAQEGAGWMVMADWEAS